MWNKSLAALLFSALVSTSAAAVTADYLQQVTINSDTQSADINESLIIFDGNVVVRQGSMEIKADRLTAQTNEDKTAKVLVATGQPATYEQVMENGAPASASAEEIRYDIATSTLTMIGNASLEQTGNKVTGHQIRYNMETQRIIAESSQGSNDRVTTILQPSQLEQEQQKQDKSSQNQG
ncbi:lipopolysaccharide transport periplasmic protein LptA [Paraferrimonas sedimenticola]|uniref:Lipopolysaccharide export system protein LptA n=1 Tax=Paraferrimonas sedimenticola TaxID=375674 RepID=A0AA37VUE0_9GAMM|nr:lipopolysaccharide transport periplasmic protein LptA [Paraferrimonas sedimenticola]GLP95829.1 lipopolysaccharide export system protein LptA [Paraferrimonas sedimenticola]